MRRIPLVRQYVYLGVVLLMLFALVAFHFKELEYAYSLYRYEGAEALGDKPSRAHLVGTVTNAPLPSGLFAMADSGNLRVAAVARRNGCFVLSVAPPPATFRSYAPGFGNVSAQVDNGYFFVRLNLSPVGSVNPSAVGVTRISAWDFITRAVKCTSSSY